jgi:Ferredoxin-like domain in Api92-like protein
MPNWCENDLTVRGPAAELDRFVAGGLDFNAAIPYPPEFAAQDAAAYAWEKAHPYGSEAFKAHLSERPTDGYDSLTRVGFKAKARFQTPWSPPLPVLDAWSQRYPTLTFGLRYYEGGMGFKGHYAVKAGEVIDNTTRPYSGPRGG